MYVIVIQVDYTLIMSTDPFMKDEERAFMEFLSKIKKVMEYKPVSFYGAVITRRGRNVVVDQPSYTKCLTTDFPRTPQGFATARGKASYAQLPLDRINLFSSIKHLKFLPPWLKQKIMISNFLHFIAEDPVRSNVPGLTEHALY